MISFGNESTEQPQRGGEEPPLQRGLTFKSALAPLVPRAGHARSCTEGSKAEASGLTPVGRFSRPRGGAARLPVGQEPGGAKQGRPRHDSPRPSHPGELA